MLGPDLRYHFALVDVVAAAVVLVVAFTFVLFLTIRYTRLFSSKQLCAVLSFTSLDNTDTGLLYIQYQYLTIPPVCRVCYESVVGKPMYLMHRDMTSCIIN